MSATLEILLGAVIIFVYYLVGKYGKDTAAGPIGSIILAIFVTPVFAFIILFFMKQRQSNSRL